MNFVLYNLSAFDFDIFIYEEIIQLFNLVQLFLDFNILSKNVKNVEKLKIFV